MRVYSPNPGYGWNPLRRYPNIPCPCECGQKAKRCVGRDEILTEAHVAEVTAYLQKLASEGKITLKKALASA